MSPKQKKTTIQKLEDGGNRVSYTELDFIKEQSMQSVRKKTVAFKEESTDVVKIIETFMQIPENRIEHERIQQSIKIQQSAQKPYSERLKEQFSFKKPLINEDKVSKRQKSQSPFQRDRKEIIPESQFDFDQYHFYDPIKIYQHKQYMEDLMSEKKVNKKKIKKTMMDMVLLQIVSRLNNEFPSLPPFMNENKQKWSIMLIKTKAFQEVFQEYTQKVASMIEKEVTKNRQQLGLYLTHPRIFKDSLSQVRDVVQMDKDNKEIGKLTQRLNMGQNFTLSGVNNKNANVNSELKATLMKIKQSPSANLSDHNESQQISSVKKAAKSTIAQALQKAIKEKQDQVVMNAEFKKIKDRVIVIDKMVENFEDNTDQLAQDMLQFELDIDSLERQARDVNPQPPLQKITDMLERWHREPIQTQDEIQKFANELWVSLDDYEKDMKESIKGHQIILAMKEYKFLTHLEWIKNKFGFYVDLYEQAFTEMKLRQNKYLEHSQMALCDHESRMLTYQKEETELSKIVYDEIPSFNNYGEAHQYISGLKKTMNTLYIESKNIKIINNGLQAKVQGLEQTKVENLQSISQWQNLFQYYQNIVIKFAKDLEILEPPKFDAYSIKSPIQQEDLMKRIKSIEKNKAILEISVQEEIIKTCEEDIALTKFMQETSSIYNLQKSYVKEMYQKLVQIGIVPQMKINMKKNAFENSSISLNIPDTDRNMMFSIFEELSQKTGMHFVPLSTIQLPARPPPKFVKPNEQQSQPGQANQPSNLIQQTQKPAQQAEQKHSKGGVKSKKKKQIQENADLLTTNQMEQPVQQQQQFPQQVGSTLSEDQRAQISSLKRMILYQNKLLKMRKKHNDQVMNQSFNDQEENENPDIKNKNTEVQQLKMMINLVQAKTIAEEEEFGYLDSKYDIVTQDDKPAVNLEQSQLEELSILVKSVSGKDVTNIDENSQLSVEAFIDKINDLILDKKNVQDIEEEEQQDKKKKKKKKKAKKQEIKKSKPLAAFGDCIQIEYNDQFELNGFSLRPKVVQHLYSQTNELHTIKELIKAVIYMNRLMTSFSSVVSKESSKEEGKQTLHMKIVQHSGDLTQDQEDQVFSKVPLYEHYANTETILSESGHNTIDNLTEQSLSPMHDSRFRTPNNLTVNQIPLRINIGTGITQGNANNKLSKFKIASQEPVKVPPVILKKETANKGVQAEPKWLLKAMGIETQSLINMVKHHLIDIICRISAYNRGKMNTLMFSEEMSGEDCQPAILGYTLKGIQKEGEDISVETYIKTVLSQINSRIKAIPPVQRKILDLSLILETLSIGNKTNNGSLSDQIHEHSCECAGNPLKRATFYSQKQAQIAPIVSNQSNYHTQYMQLEFLTSSNQTQKQEEYKKLKIKSIIGKANQNEESVLFPSSTTLSSRNTAVNMSQRFASQEKKDGFFTSGPKNPIPLMYSSMISHGFGTAVMPKIMNGSNTTHTRNLTQANFGSRNMTRNAIDISTQRRKQLNSMIQNQLLTQRQITSDVSTKNSIVVAMEQTFKDQTIRINEDLEIMQYQSLLISPRSVQTSNLQNQQSRIGATGGRLSIENRNAEELESIVNEVNKLHQL